MKYRVVGTTMIHGDEKGVSTYYEGDTVQMPEEMGANNPHLVQVEEDKQEEKKTGKKK